MIGSNMQPLQRLRTRCVISAYVYGVGTSLEGKTTKMANFQSMCSFFRINCVLRIEIEQLEEKLKFIKQVEWLNLSVERLTQDYNCKIATKKAQIIDNQAAASNIVAAAMQQ